MIMLMDNGEEEVFKYVGQEGTVDPFNSLYKLYLTYITKLANSMMNAGVILQHL